MFVLNTNHFGFVNMGSVALFLYRKMVLFGGAFWVFFRAYLFPLFGFFIRNLFRLHANSSDCSVQEPEPEFEAKPDRVEIKDFDDDESSKEESPRCILKFRFHTYEEFSTSYRENDDSLSRDAAPSTSTNKYEFISGNGYSGFMEESQVVNHTVSDLFLDSKDDSSSNKEILNDGLVSEKDFMEHNSESGAALKKLQEDCTESLCKEKLLERTHAIGLADRLFNAQEISNEVQFLSKDFTVDSDSKSIISNHDFNEDDNAIKEELQDLETESPNTLNSEFLSEKDFYGDNYVKIQEEEFGGEPSSQNSSKLETLWEHQDLIEQLKMELRKVRATGLPTILEESESPKIMEDLQQPWKIDEKFQHEDKLDELHKFYKSYRERMRKFDILNYQKMYALGFLQSKDQFQLVSSSKVSVPATTLENFRLLKPKKAKESDPTVKFIREFHSDMEMVYVGQMCLSWEFLHWQYEKVLELWESDPHGIHGYNEVAGEFQQFQVHMQRFIENEAFQGPRVQNYVKNRCVLRNLLQVPVIREDNMKDKKKARRIGRDETTITSDMLVEIMEESIRVFWRFVRADHKHEVNMILKGLKGTQIELQDPADSKFLSEVRTTLQKKEKKLKDLLRTGNCILKRFRKNQEESSDQVLYFFSQVDMKLVSRVLNMSRITTEQLVWCHNKLSRISFVNRKIRVESSFLLFPGS